MRLDSSDIDEEAVKALVDTKVLKPQRGGESTGQSHIKMLVSVQSRNSNRWRNRLKRPKGLLKNLGRLLKIPTPVRTSLTIAISRGLVQSLLWLLLSMET